MGRFTQGCVEVSRTEPQSDDDAMLWPGFCFALILTGRSSLVVHGMVWMGGCLTLRQFGRAGVSAGGKTGGERGGGECGVSKRG